MEEMNRRRLILLDERAQGAIVIIGASSGLGHGISCGFPEVGDVVWCASRNRPPSLDRADGVHRRWIEADLSVPDQVRKVEATIGPDPVRLLIFCAVVWESETNIENVEAEELYRILSVNTSSFIAVTKSLAKNLRAACGSATVIAIGSTFGLDNGPGDRAAYAASKFGLRGAVNAFRSAFRPDHISVTCISPGSLASEVEFEDGRKAALERFGGDRIPTADIIAIIRCLESLTPATCVKEIVIPAMNDLDV